MGSENEDGVLDIHFGNKTDDDFGRINLVKKNTSDSNGRFPSFTGLLLTVCSEISGGISL
jgi:hypothetical protein